MKLEILLRRVHEETAEIEVASFEEARQVMRTLTNDSFSERDEYTEITVVNEEGLNVTGQVQPFCPHVQP